MYIKILFLGILITNTVDLSPIFHHPENVSIYHEKTLRESSRTSDYLQVHLGCALRIVSHLTNSILPSTESFK